MRLDKTNREEERLLRSAEFKPTNARRTSYVGWLAVVALSFFIGLTMSAHIDESTSSFTNLEASVLDTSAEPHYYKIIIDASTKYALDPRLIATIIYIESGGNVKAVSPKGAKGLMQLTPIVYKHYGVNDPFEVEQNIHVGTAYFALLLDRFDGNLEHALAAYNCGPSRVMKHKGLPPIRETRDYVQRVMDFYMKEAVPVRPASGDS
jgi:soluble lytic murein transglycosylase-like protein